jgi:Tol biopolymer transport system component
MCPFCKQPLRNRPRLARLALIESALDDIPLRARREALRVSGGTGSSRWLALLGRRIAMAAAVASACLLTAGLLATRALAIYGPAAGGFGADIVSVDNASDEQGNAATTDADISANGRYVVFQTRATNFFEDDGGVVGPDGVEPDAEPAGTLRKGGIFRYDRDTGAIQLVADGSETYTEGPEKGTLIFRGAQNPSVSADGRYVVFSTAQQLVPQDTNNNVDVYVRDMDVPLTVNRKESGAYTLVSSRSGGDEPATYAPREQPLKGEEPGSEVWPNTSMSADGRYVVFRTTELKSNLPATSATDTPPLQLFVRDLQAKTTTLLTRNKTTGEPISNAQAPVGAIGPATISPDGSTVAWVSTGAPEQTQFIKNETEDVKEPYYLWRRWQEPEAKTRRITGIADPEDPECHGQEEVDPAERLATGPCYGPLTEPESGLASIDLAAPGLSSDGYTVAFLAGAALRTPNTKSTGLDVFLTSMRPGVTRKAGTRELTLDVPSGNIGSTPSIESLALSPDGSTIAFTTARDDFVLPEPRPVGAFRAFPRAIDLYIIHLAENSLERAVVNYEGGDPNESALVNPTLTQNGSSVAFVSYASNLIFGDANEQPDAFAATIEAPGGTAAPSTEVNSVQGGFSLAGTAAPELGLSVKRAKDGGLILLIETPGAGKLTARAAGTITAAAGRKKRKRKVELAHTSGSARSEGTTTLTLRLASKYAKDLRSAGKLKALVTVSFMPADAGEMLSAEAGGTFVGAKQASKASGKAKGKKG